MRHKEPIALAKIASSVVTASMRSLWSDGYQSGWAGRGAGPGGKSATTGAADERSWSAPHSPVMATESLPTSGGTVTAMAHRAHITVTIPSGAFPHGALIELTDPDISRVDGGVVGVGLQVSLDGHRLTSNLDRPLILAIDDPEIRPGDIVEIWDGQAFFIHPQADVSAGRAVVELTGEGDLVVVLDDSTAHRPGT